MAKGASVEERTGVDESEEEEADGADAEVRVVFSGGGWETFSVGNSSGTRGVEFFAAGPALVRES
jgi:hypothetical protein